MKKYFENLEKLIYSDYNWSECFLIVSQEHFLKELSEHKRTVKMRKDKQRYGRSIDGKKVLFDFFKHNYNIDKVYIKIKENN